MARPNLFDEARGELAQDALLAWLANWAGPDNAQHSPVLHAAGTALLVKIGLLREGERPERVHATCQTGVGPSRPDLIVAATVGGEARASIIEHKVHAGLNAKQLTKYQHATRSLTGLSPEQVTTAFIKTGLLTRQERRSAPAGWRVLDLKALLALLSPFVAQTDDAILRDYVESLARRQARIEAWRSAAPPYSSPDCLEWQGLLEALSATLSLRLGGFVGHGLVNPPGGGTFAGMWWGWTTVGEHQLYLQAHPNEGNLRARVAVRCKRADEKGKVSTPVLQAFREHVARSPRFARAPRIRPGVYSSVANAMGPWWRTTEQGGVDLDATVEGLVTLTEALKEVLGAAHGAAEES
ncbi:MAG: hypothetical protein H6741_18010 [Alphaproteobacteria bacterium]|nr:hypothetical protein [Alphaproteobacteria bacterium]